MNDTLEPFFFNFSHNKWKRETWKDKWCSNDRLFSTDAWSDIQKRTNMNWFGPVSWFRETADTGLLYKSSCLARALGVTKFISTRYTILVTLCCATYVWLRCSTNLTLRPVCWTKGSCLAWPFGVTKFISTKYMILSHFVVLLKSDLDVQQTRLWFFVQKLMLRWSFRRIQIYKCLRSSHVVQLKSDLNDQQTTPSKVEIEFFWQMLVHGCTVNVRSIGRTIN